MSIEANNKEALRGEIISKPFEDAKGNFILNCESNKYELMPDGLYLTQTITKGSASSEVTRKIGNRICVSKIYSNDTGDEQGCVVLFKDRHRKEKSALIPMSELAKRETLDVLINKGYLYLETPKQNGQQHVGEFLFQYVMQHGDSLQEIELIKRRGWTSDRYEAFTIGTEIISNDETAQSKFVFNTNKTTKKDAKGELSQWQEQIASVAVRCTTKGAFAICASLSAPLLDASIQPSVGFHFYGASSIGKTTILHMAGSVWGRAGNSAHGGNTFSWNGTENALGGKFALFNDQCLCLDEIGQAKKKDIESVAYLLGNGRGRDRCNVDGELRDGVTYRCVVLSTGEISFRDGREGAILGKQFNDGESVRMIDIPAESSGATFGIFKDVPDDISKDNATNAGKILTRRISRLCSVECFGTAGREFLLKLMKDIRETGVEAFAKESQAQIDAISIKFANAYGADEKLLRVATSFAFVAYAGELATSYGILPWNSGDATKVAFECFGDWASSDSNFSKNTEKVLEDILEFSNRNPNQFYTYRLAQYEDELSNHLPNGIEREMIGYKVLSDDGLQTIAIIFNRTAFSRLLKECAGIQKKKFFKDLEKLHKGVLIYIGTPEDFVYQIGSAKRCFGLTQNTKYHVLVLARINGQKEDADKVENILRGRKQ